MNFVNNFAEVNDELLTDLEEEQEKEPRNPEYEKQIIADIRQNLGKINFHGKRADSIVKGMLQHSRASSGQKEFVDINALADEYLRLAYHGLRAKDKSFNVTIQTNFDKNLSATENKNDNQKVAVIPQDIGRVLLNLYNNSFYAVAEKNKKMQQQRDTGYQPTITVSTKRNLKNVEIVIRDNGNGIPEHIGAKIFQPFFTTKPTGQGTGLGLSLSYDIITKGHNGEMEMESKEGEYAEFTITLPVA